MGLRNMRVLLRRTMVIVVISAFIAYLNGVIISCLVSDSRPAKRYKSVASDTGRGTNWHMDIFEEYCLTSLQSYYYDWSATMTKEENVSHRSEEETTQAFDVPVDHIYASKPASQITPWWLDSTWLTPSRPGESKEVSIRAFGWPIRTVMHVHVFRDDWSIVAPGQPMKGCEYGKLTMGNIYPFESFRVKLAYYPLPYGLLVSAGLHGIVISTCWWVCSRLRSASRRGRCPHCGYPLHGLTQPGCPECGWNRPAGEGAATGSTRDPSSRVRRTSESLRMEE